MNPNFFTQQGVNLWNATGRMRRIRWPWSGHLQRMAEHGGREKLASFKRNRRR